MVWCLEDEIFFWNGNLLGGLSGLPIRNHFLRLTRYRKVLATLRLFCQNTDLPGDRVSWPHSKSTVPHRNAPNRFPHLEDGIPWLASGKKPWLLHEPAQRTKVRKNCGPHMSGIRIKLRFWTQKWRWMEDPVFSFQRGRFSVSMLVFGWFITFCVQDKGNWEKGNKGRKCNWAPKPDTRKT